jgi:XisH protein
MPARDLYHDVVKAALIADGWTITHDPLKLSVGKKDLFVDLGAERLLAADKDGRKIAVETKSFLGTSEVADLEKALGQYILYREILEEDESERLIYLAVSGDVYEDLFLEPIGQLLLRRQRLRLIVFNPEKGVIIQWIPD